MTVREDSEIKKHLGDFLWIMGMVVVGLFAVTIILSNQRFYLPAWVPGLGTDFFELKGEFTTAQAVTPGQGQTVNIAGVSVGEIKRVELENGRAIVTMSIRQKYAKLVKRDATMLLRPKTGLKDMIVELDPGTRGAKPVEEGYTVPVSQTQPDVNLDEIWAALDRDTRDYVKLLVAGGGEALRNNGPATARVLRRFEPLNRDVSKLTTEVAKRRKNLARLIHNAQLLVTEVGTKDKELAELIVSQNAVFQAFANQDQKLRETIRLLPEALAATNEGLSKSDTLSKVLAPALRDLNPGFSQLDEAQRALRPFARQTTPIIKDKLRPFAREAQGPVSDLRPALRDLAYSTPRLSTTFRIFNKLVNALAYNPKGNAEGYLFWAMWLNHIGASVYSTQDANGPIRRGVILTDCVALDALANVRLLDNQLGTLIDLTNLPTKQEACPSAVAARKGGGK